MFLGLSACHGVPVMFFKKYFKKKRLNFKYMYCLTGMIQHQYFSPELSSLFGTKQCNIIYRYSAILFF